MVLAEETSHPRQAFVALNVERGTVLLGRHRHGAELIEHEGPSAATDTLLPEDGRTAILVTDDEIQHHERRREHQQST